MGSARRDPGWAIAAASSVDIGHAALDVAIATRPRENLTLRNKAMLIREHAPKAQADGNSLKNS